jgi:hypothetical protein
MEGQDTRLARLATHVATRVVPSLVALGAASAVVAAILGPRGMAVAAGLLAICASGTAAVGLISVVIVHHVSGARWPAGVAMWLVGALARLAVIPDREEEWQALVLQVRSDLEPRSWRCRWEVTRLVAGFAIASAKEFPGRCVDFILRSNAICGVASGCAVTYCTIATYIDGGFVRSFVTAVTLSVALLTGILELRRICGISRRSGGKPQDPPG